MHGAFYILTALSMVGCSQPNQDHFGGGSFQVQFGDGGPVSGTFDVAGASQECLDAHDRDFCDAPKASLGNATEGSTQAEQFDVSAWLVYPASESRPDCFGDAELELNVFLVQDLDVGGPAEMWFSLEDPVLTADDPNADQGGATSAGIRGTVQLDGAIEPAAAGAETATLAVSEDRNCAMDDAEVEMTLTWDFDPAVTAGAGLFALE